MSQDQTPREVTPDILFFEHLCLHGNLAELQAFRERVGMETFRQAFNHSQRTKQGGCVFILEELVTKHQYEEALTAVPEFFIRELVAPEVYESLILGLKVQTVLAVTRDSPNVAAFQAKREQIFTEADEEFPTLKVIQRDLATLLTALKRYDAHRETSQKVIDHILNKKYAQENFQSTVYEIAATYKDRLGSSVLDKMTEDIRDQRYKPGQVNTEPQSSSASQGKQKAIIQDEEEEQENEEDTTGFTKTVRDPHVLIDTLAQTAGSALLDLWKGSHPVSQEVSKKRKRGVLDQARNTEQNDEQKQQEDEEGENRPAKELRTNLQSTRGTLPSGLRSRIPWTADEVEKLYIAVAQFKEGNWAKMIQLYGFGDRTGVDLKDKWRNLRKKFGPKHEEHLAEVKQKYQDEVNAQQSEDDE